MRVKIPLPPSRTERRTDTIPALMRRLLVGVLVLGACGAGLALAHSGVGEGLIGPQNHIQPSGRELNPPGTLTKLGNHPGGGALTPDGRFLWTLSAGRGKNDVRIVNVATGAVVQAIPMPGVDGGIAMASDGRTAYVSGTPESSHKDQQTPAGRLRHGASTRRYGSR